MSGRAAGLLALEFGIGNAFEDGETGLFGPGDGDRGEKFRGVYLLNGDAGDGLAAGGAGRERGVGGVMPVIEALVAEFAGGFDGGVAVNRHEEGNETMRTDLASTVCEGAKKAGR